MMFINKLDADLSCGMPIVKSPIVVARISLFVLWTNTDVILIC